MGIPHDIIVNIGCMIHENNNRMKVILTQIVVKIIIKSIGKVHFVTFGGILRLNSELK
jgi:hypothetical protein